METKWLEDFLCLAKAGSFSKAAEQRNVTQPAFSRRIKALESWLGAGLIDRANYPVTLTSEGFAFKSVAENVLKQLYGSREKFQNQWRCTDIDISFASLDSLSTSFFPSWLKHLEKNGSVPATQLLQNSLKECVGYLERDNCDFVLCYNHDWAKNPLEHNDYVSVVLAQEKLVPICLADHQQSKNFSLQGTMENPLPLLAYSPDCFLGQIMEVAMDKLNKKHALKIVYENSTATSLKVMVEHGYGIAWIPERLIAREIANKEVSIISDFDWIPSLEIRLYRPKRKKRKIVEEFWSQILAEKGSQKKIRPYAYTQGISAETAI
ncbi:MAG: LysR family transcriptional regulator [Methyloligellaceae bacterium]